MRRVSSRSERWAGPAAVLGALSLLLAACSAENNGQNSLKPRGPQAEKIDNLFIPVFWISVVIGVLVLGAVVVFALHYRYRRGRNENPRQIHGSPPLTTRWTIVPPLTLPPPPIP